MRLKRAPRDVVGVGVEREDRREIGLGRPRQAEAILLGAGVGPLVRADPAGPVLLDADAGEESPTRARLAVGSGVVLRERPEGVLRVGGDDAL